jgi:hypothetical protein
LNRFPTDAISCLLYRVVEDKSSLNSWYKKSTQFSNRAYPVNC